MSVRQVAILGSGIMGSATALFLARQGVRVRLFDAADRPFAGASRWNEGKIHLGYLYCASASTRTARRILPGGLRFKELTESLLGCSLAGAATADDDIYLVHRDSVASADAVHRYLD
jgi:glycine/D-amino acid oxidase-like deaminating enzyme